MNNSMLKLRAGPSETYNALSLQGWKVPESQPTEGSKVEIEARIVFVSLPVRPLFSLTRVIVSSSRSRILRFWILVMKLTVGNDVST